jgi:hypothetical protein
MFDIVQYKRDNLEIDSYGIFFARDKIKDKATCHCFPLTRKELAILRNQIDQVLHDYNTEPKEEGE